MKNYNLNELIIVESDVIIPAPPSRLLVDYSANLTYMYIREKQQCTVTNASAHSMGTTNEILFQFGDIE